MSHFGVELRSTFSASGELTLALEDVAIEAPGAGEVVVRIEAAPINPTDMGLLVGPADVSTLESSGTTDRPILRMTVPATRRERLGGRIDQSLPVGNEGAGVVIEAGEGAEALLGKRVAVIGGGMFTQFRRLPMQACVVLPDDVSAEEGAALFVNPLTSVAFTEVMRREGHHAIVHTAAASNLGRMLNRLCVAENIPLVNIVRSSAQVELLRAEGATYALNSGDPDFVEQLDAALDATRATLLFDAIGGGAMVGTVLGAMERSASRQAGDYSRYGSSMFKQAYIYGALDEAPTTLLRDFGFSWSVGSWLLTPFLQKIGVEASMALRQRVLGDIKTIFASRFSHKISLAEALRPETFVAFERKRTGEKYCIDPTL